MITFDKAKLRADRLKRIHDGMRRCNVGALLLTDPIHIRFATGVSVMPLWTAVNYARYVLVPADREPVIFEYSEALFSAQESGYPVRPTKYWQYRFAQGRPAEMADIWGGEIADLLKEYGLHKEVVAID